MAVADADAGPVLGAAVAQTAAAAAAASGAGVLAVFLVIAHSAWACRPWRPAW
ncbi:hypothetical protein [Actinacidiphila glaucinigra]|uniref:hypothetical protein n=1 Tax=Actinacidiphila glaucinigra TaxID=235986 RepID=UPI002E2EB6AF|nr:hypothetical protein [Actinacidiphila glaucinigra]